jgi:hypothetical protein
LRVKVIDGEVEGKIRRFESKGREKGRQLRSKVDKERDKEEVTAASGSTIYMSFQRGSESRPMIGKHGSGTIGGI